MKKKKLFLALGLIAASTFAFTSCKSTTEAKTDAKTQDTTTAATTTAATTTAATTTVNTTTDITDVSTTDVNTTSISTGTTSTDVTTAEEQDDELKEVIGLSSAILSIYYNEDKTIDKMTLFDTDAYYLIHPVYNGSKIIALNINTFKNNVSFYQLTEGMLDESLPFTFSNINNEFVFNHQPRVLSTDDRPSVIKISDGAASISSDTLSTFNDGVLESSYAKLEVSDTLLKSFKVDISSFRYTNIEIEGNVIKYTYKERGVFRNSDYTFEFDGTNFTTYIGDSTKLISTIGDNGEILSSDYYDDGEILYKITYTYNDNGLLTSVETGNEVSNISYTYDESLKLVNTSEYYNQYEYTYNDDSLLESKIVKSQGTVVSSVLYEDYNKFFIPEKSTNEIELAGHSSNSSVIRSYSDNGTVLSIKAYNGDILIDEIINNYNDENKYIGYIENRYNTSKEFIQSKKVSSDYINGLAEFITSTSTDGINYEQESYVYYETGIYNYYILFKNFSSGKLIDSTTFSYESNEDNVDLYKSVKTVNNYEDGTLVSSTKESIDHTVEYKIIRDYYESESSEDLKQISSIIETYLDKECSKIVESITTVYNDDSTTSITRIVYDYKEDGTLKTTYKSLDGITYTLENELYIPTDANGTYILTTYDSEERISSEKTYLVDENEDEYTLSYKEYDYENVPYVSIYIENYDYEENDYSTYTKTTYYNDYSLKEDGVYKESNYTLIWSTKIVYYPNGSTEEYTLNFDTNEYELNIEEDPDEPLEDNLDEPLEDENPDDAGGEEDPDLGAE